jgi:hypothetical protein
MDCLRTRFALGVLVISCCVVVPAWPQQQPVCTASKNTQHRVLASRLADWAEIYLSRENPNRQAEAPSLSDNSTTLADTAKPTDLATLSLNPAATTTNSRTPKSTDLSTSFSLAAVAAAVTQQSPLGSGFYSSPVAENLRRISFAASDSFPGQSSATVGKGSETYGLKFRLYPGLRKKRASLLQFFQAREDDLASANVVNPMVLTASSSVFQQGVAKIRAYLVSQLMTTPISVGFDGSRHFNQIEAQDATASIEKLDEGVECALAAKDRSLDSLLEQTAEQLLTDPTMRELEKKDLGAPEVSVESSARLSKGTGSNVYRNQLDYSQTFARTFANTINLGFDFQNAQTFASKNRNIARFVEQVQFPFNFYHRDLRNGGLKLALGGEGDWGSNGPPTYKALGKLTVTPFAGFQIPMAVNYTNRTTGVNRGDIRAQIGLAVDFTRLWVRPTKSLENALAEIR